MSEARIHLLSPEVRRDPFPVYARLRQSTATQVDPGGLWAIARHADVARALHDPTTFSSRGFRAALAPPWLGDDRLASFLIAIDPPEHTTMRALISRAFRRDAISALDQPLRRLVRSFCESVDASQDVEVVGRLAGPIAATAIGLMLDLDPADHPRLKGWIDILGRITPVEPDLATATAIRAAIEEQHAYLYALLEQRRRHPGRDVVSQLLASEVDGRRLEPAELASFLSLLLAAGIDTTVHLISKAMLLLSARADLHSRLRAEPALIPEFLEEMLRYDPPTHGLLRSTTHDVWLDDVCLPTGAFVLLLIASANRDPAQYERADEFLLQRRVRGNLAFGHGPHVCLGALLARLEARIAFEVMLEYFAAFERDPALPVTWDMAIHTRGPTSLNMRLVPA